MDISSATNLSMRKSVKVASGLNVLISNNDVTVAAAGSCRHDILVEGERNEDDKRQKIHYRTNSSHGFGSRVQS